MAKIKAPDTRALFPTPRGSYDPSPPWGNFPSARVRFPNAEDTAPSLGTGKVGRLGAGGGGGGKNPGISVSVRYDIGASGSEGGSRGSAQHTRASSIIEVHDTCDTTSMPTHVASDCV